MNLPKISLGSSGLSVTPLGLGTVKFGRNTGVKYPSAFNLPSRTDLKNLLHFAKDQGINLLDTAPAYGNSEEILGRLLSQDRQDWVIVSKAGEEYVNNTSWFDFSPAHLRASVERSLRRLGTDYLDAVLIHSDGNDVDIINNQGAFDTLSQLKKQGLIRAFGMSTKTLEGGLLTVAQADIVMLTYNPLYTAESPVIDKAHELNKGVIIKKALASGHLNQLPGKDPVLTAFEFIFERPGALSVIVGSINQAHLARNVACVKQVSNERLVKKNT